MASLCPLLGLLANLIFQSGVHPWPHTAGAQSLVDGIASPPGSKRTSEPDESFATWLRRLPLKPSGTPVRLFDGRSKPNQAAHARVIDLDVGSKDHQQCADAVMRLWAEYLFTKGKGEDICFRATNGSALRWTKWRAGERPRVRGATITWSKEAAADATWPTFRRYLDFVFVYAGSYSLAKELLPVSADDPIQPGDVFIQGGFPGHAVIVVDVAQDTQGRRVFLLAQSYMPAQDVHVLRGPKGEDPWYRFPVGDTLETPEWTFSPARRMRFRAHGCEAAPRR
jgi:hypothetical protein